MQVVEFLEILESYYTAHERDLPWRIVSDDQEIDPYAVVVSELMLQQTQVTRVLPKFTAFMDRFPTMHSLASAQLGEVLAMWSGLGYNRRAKYLHTTVQALIGRDFPRTVAELVTLPGIGQNTAGAVLAYAYNLPVVFVETNIRTVFLYHFFSGQEKVRDTEIAAVVAACIDYLGSDTDHAIALDIRNFYWALMDYGTYLKNQGVTSARDSATYRTQSKFAGSVRQLRGRIMKILLDAGTPVALSEISLQLPDARLSAVLADLEQDGLLVQQGEFVQIP